MSAPKPGDTIFDVTRPGASREQLAAFSIGTEDPNPIHVDEAFAKSAGFPTVLQQGPMTTAHLGALLAAVFVFILFFGIGDALTKRWDPYRRHRV